MANSWIARKMVKKSPVTENERERIDIGFNEYINQIALDIYNRYLNPDGFCRSTCFKYAHSTGISENTAIERKQKTFEALINGITNKITAFIVDSGTE